MLTIYVHAVLRIVWNGY